MARRRDYAREYRQRLSRGLERGQTRQEARGKGRGPEHPIRALSDPARFSDYIRERFDTMDVLALTPEGQRRLARVNDARRREGKAPIEIGPPPYPGPGVRQFTTDSFAEAEDRSAGPPPDYATIYIWREGFTAEKRSPVRSSRRRAA